MTPNHSTPGGNSTVARALVAAFVLAVAFSGTARSEMRVWGGLENFGWSEYSASGARLLTETGYRYNAGLQYLQDRDNGFLFGYYGKAYTNTVRYDGVSSNGNPITTDSIYQGMLNEAQARYRLGGGTGGGQSHSMDIVVGLGLEFWERRLKSVGTVSGYDETYSITVIKAGMDFRPSADGLIVEAGMKKPLGAEETVKLKDAGLALENASLKPAGEISFYGSAGWRFKNRMTLMVVYDSYRFGRSPGATINTSGGPVAYYQPASKMDTVNFTLGYDF